MLAKAFPIESAPAFPILLELLKLKFYVIMQSLILKKK